MAIYRGPGGAGDATGDATNASALALAARDEAQASASSAASSATAAANSATAADTSSTSAATSASNAAGSATTASTAATNASNSASDASDSADAAASSASDASDSATAAADSATSASTSASAASTSATNAASSASSASTSASTATTKASEASTSATNAASSASAASTSETNAASSASAASTSETNAASSASSASTSASNASTSASTATTQATNAASSASAAATSETNAASSASAASTSASNASTSATNAASSASSAASSAASAAAALDSFDDRYLGSKTSDPTLDNDGNALVTGALYYNSTDGEMRVYDGSQWIAASAASQAILTKYKYIATAGQTTFSGPDANALTLAYTVGSIIVTLNGVVMDAVDYTASSGTSIVLASAASLNDEVGIFAFSTFDVANTYTQAQADAKFVELTGDTMTGDLRLNNGYADGAQLQLASSGYSDWNWDNYSGRLRAYYGSTEYFTINSSGNVGIGTSSPDVFSRGESRTLGISGSGGVSIGINAATGNNPYLYLGVNNTRTVQLLGNATEPGLYSATSLPLLFGTNFTERMRIDSSGNLLVGTTSAGGKLSVTTDTNIRVAFFYLGAASSTTTPVIRCVKYDNSTATSNKFIEFEINQGATGSGQINANGANAAAFGSYSDARLKENIVDLPSQLANICALRPVEFDYIESEGGGHQIGFVAQEVQQIYPDVVGEDEEGMLTLTGWSKTEARLVKAIQEQQAIIEQLTERLSALENK